jgi:hypothetical protein
MEEYRELIQFSLYVGTAKVRYLENGRLDPTCVMKIWNRTNWDTSCPVGLKKCTFDEYVDLIRTGHTVRRVCKVNGNLVPSRFLFIDFDNKIGENITEKEIRSLESDQVKIMPSASYIEGSEEQCYRWHAYLYSSENIWNVTDLRRITEEFVDKLRRVCGRPISYDERIFRSMHQVCYGRPQLSYELEIPEGVEEFSKQLKVEDDFKIHPVSYEEIESSESTTDPSRQIVPYNSRMLLRRLADRGITELHDKSFSISPPFTFRNKLLKSGKTDWKIQVGRRYFTGQCWARKLAAQWYKCNLKYDLGYTYEDLEYTLNCLCKTNFDEFEDFDMTNVLAALKKEVKIYEGKTYEQIESLAVGQIRYYREQATTLDLILKMKDEFCTDDEFTIMFQDRRQMLEVFKKYHITKYTVKKYMNMLGFEISIMRRAQKKRKTEFDFEKYKRDEKGRYLVPSNEITPYMRNVASKQKIKLKAVNPRLYEHLNRKIDSDYDL